MNTIWGKPQPGDLPKHVRYDIADPDVVSIVDGTVDAFRLGYDMPIRIPAPGLEIPAIYYSSKQDIADQLRKILG